MKKTNSLNDNSQTSLPEWYWKSGLHDAEIVSAEELILDYDYKLRNPERNCYVLHLNANGALFDTKVKEIRLYNYKIITPDFKFISGEKPWWISDRLTTQNGKYLLDIELEILNGDRQHFIITFERAEAIRK